jgi:hypothetical protein
MKKIFFLSMMLLCSMFFLFPSDRSDATDLMNKCDANSKLLELPIRNFGDDKEIAGFENSLNIIKSGKVKLAQSLFVEAKQKFEEYLKSESSLYESLSPKYLKRSQEIIDKISEDLVDYVNQANVLKNFTESSQNLDQAKMYFNNKNYQSVLLSCKISKYLVINCYVLAKKPIPKEYQKDLEDYYNRIYKQ